MMRPSDEGATAKVADVYHECPLPSLKADKHTVTAEVKVLASGKVERVVRELVVG